MKKLNVLILGSGAGGLFLARDLCLSGCEVTVASEIPLAQFASTRNQGWLQAGALYAGMRQPAVARECRIASNALAALAPSAIDHAKRCFYLFVEGDDADEFVENASSAGIEVRAKKNASTIDSVKGWIGTGSTRQFDYAVEAFDRPFNTVVALQTVRDQAAQLGCRFRKLDLAKHRITQRGASWRLPGVTKPFDKVVVAAGAETGAIASALGLTTITGKYDRSWITVLTVAGVRLEAMLISPEDSTPILVPFAPGLGDGFTAVLTRADSPGPPVETDVPRKQADIETGISQFLPGLGLAITASGITRKAHYCTKLVAISDRTARGATIEANSVRNLFAFYPGKFTTAMLAARDCSLNVQEGRTGRIHIKAQPYP